VFASLVINPAGAEGGLAQVGRQAVAAGITVAFAFLGTLAILAVVDRLVGFRLTPDAEEQGVDLAEHGEAAYALREHVGRSVVHLPDDDEGLAAMRERLVLEATARVLEAVRTEEVARNDRPPG
jgi:hypothetical protein